MSHVQGYVSCAWFKLTCWEVSNKSDIQDISFAIEERQSEKSENDNDHFREISQCYCKIKSNNIHSSSAGAALEGI